MNLANCAAHHWKYASKTRFQTSGELYNLQNYSTIYMTTYNALLRDKISTGKRLWPHIVLSMHFTSTTCWTWSITFLGAKEESHLCVCMPKHICKNTLVSMLLAMICTLFSLSIWTMSFPSRSFIWKMKWHWLSKVLNTYIVNKPNSLGHAPKILQWAIIHWYGTSGDRVLTTVSEIHE